MEKRRVYQVAKEQKLSSDALISMLKEMDFEIKSHMSVVSEDMLNAITRKIQEEKQSSIAEVKRQKEKEVSRKQSESPAKETPKKVGGGGRRRSTASSTGGVAKRGSVPNPPVEAPAPEKEEGSRRRNKRRGKRDGNPMQDMRDGLTEKREVTARSS